MIKQLEIMLGEYGIPENSDLKIITPKAFKDDRGYFMEDYSQSRYMNDYKLPYFVQDNISVSCKNTIRGLHFQKGDAAQAKLVEVLHGSVIDFVVDIRLMSDTYGKLSLVYLSDNNHKQFYIPRGFAHGFIALEDDTLFHYKCDNYYNKEAEGGFNINSPYLKIFDNLKKYIDIDIDNLTLSPKDMQWPEFKA